MGERLPESFFDTVHDAVDLKTGTPTQVRLGDHRDKLIILDFWATWCGPCIASLNKLDTLKRELQDPRFVVIPVTGQSAREIEPVIKRFAWDTPSIVGDRTLARIFPHNGLPHMVWIKDDRVMAIPFPSYATKQNIATAIEGGQPRMVMKIRDQMLDPMKPLFVEDNGATGLWYKSENSKIARHVRNYRSEPTQVVYKGDSTIVYCVNQPLLALFYQAYEREIFQHFHANNGGVLLNVAPEIERKLRQGPPPVGPDNTAEQDSAYLTWHERNAFGYELRVKGHLSDRDARKIMQQDIGKFFGVYRGISARVVPGPKHRYGVLKLRGTKEETLRLLTVGNLPESLDADKYYRFPKGQYYSQLYMLMADRSLRTSPGLGLTTRVVDSTGIDRNTPVSIYFPRTLKEGQSLKQINRELERYGLYIELEEKQVPILELSQTNNF